MKKRSLFAAVAMLIVSAVVLTSATYAWFASGSTANVTLIGASVSNSDGTLLISADGTNYKTTLAYTDWQGVSGNYGINTTSNGSQVFAPLNPISFGINDTGMPMIAGGISQVTTGENAGKYQFTATGAASTSDYVDLTFYVKATFKCVVSVAPTFVSGKNFVYGALVCDGTDGSDDSDPENVIPAAINDLNTKTVRGKTGATGYYPVIKTSGSALDNNGRNDIVDAAEDAAANEQVADRLLGTQVVPDSNNLKFVITEAMANAGTPVTIHLYIWAEGQDTSCTGSVQNAEATMTVALTKTAFPSGS